MKILNNRTPSVVHIARLRVMPCNLFYIPVGNVAFFFFFLNGPSCTGIFSNTEQRLDLMSLNYRGIFLRFFGK